MNELLDASVSPANLMITILAVFLLVYWITVIIGVIDLDLMDLDVDVDADVDSGASVGWVNSVLAFFNLGQVPVMIFLSFLIFPAWGVMLIATDALGIQSFWLGLIILIPVLIVCLFAAKFMTMPFVKIFGKLSEEKENEVVVGKICEITTPTRDGKIGQAKVVTKGAPLILNVCTIPGGEMSKGDRGLVIEYQKERNIYLVEPYNN
jgi:hypothetical protein